MPSELAGAPATALLDEAASGGQGLGQAVLPDNYGMFGQEGMGPSVAESLGYTSETPIEIAERATQEELGEQALAAPEDALEGMTKVAIERRRQLKREAEAEEFRARQAKLQAEEDANEARKIREQEQLFAETSSEMENMRLEWDQLSQRETDPDRWWSSRSTGQKIGAYVSAAIQGWLNPTGPNSTIELMERAINRDIEVQARDLANQRAGMSQQMSLMQWHYNKTGDIIAAAHSSKAAALKQGAAKLAADMVQFNAEGTQAEDAELQRRAMLEKAAQEDAAALAAQQEKKRRDRMADELHGSKLADAVAGRASKFAGIARGKEASKREDRKLDEAQAEREAKTARLQKDDLYQAILDRGGDPETERDKFTAVLFPGGKVGAYRTTEPAKTETYFNSARDMAEGIDELLAMRDDAGRWTLSTADLAKEMQAVYGLLTLDAKNFFDLGAITEADAKLIERVIAGDPNAIKDPTALLNKVRSKLESKVRGKLIQNQVKGASDFAYTRLEGAEVNPGMAGVARDELKSGRPNFDEKKNRIDEELKRQSEKFPDSPASALRNPFLEGVIKDNPNDKELADYARGLMK